MQPIHKLAQLSGIVIVSFAAVVIGLSAYLFAPAAPAYAATGTPPPAATPAPGAKADERLARGYARTQDWLEIQADRLTRANEALAKAQTLIDDLKAQGKDTTALENALAAAKTQVAAAQAAHDTAASELSTHAGFDADGKVSDRAQARQTLKSARTALQDARLTLKQAQLDLRIALRNWRKDNKPAK